MKQPWEWDENDLLKLIETGEKENIQLDYKACYALALTDRKKDEISKDVSAFANSGGGTIIYGIIEDGNIPTKLDIGYDPNQISKEWIEQVINSRIQRRIDNIIINPVELKSSFPGKVAYVVHVPQSMRAPHQAGDKRFYKRFNFSCVPMEEYEIRDVSRRYESPDLTISFALKSSPSIWVEANKTNVIPVKIMAIITNNSPTPAEYIVINIYLDERLIINANPNGFNQVGHVNLLKDDQPYHFAQLHKNHLIPNAMPIFEGVNFKLFDAPLEIIIPTEGKYLIGWDLKSPRMQNKISIAYITRKEDLVSLVEL